MAGISTPFVRAISRTSRISAILSSGMAMPVTRTWGRQGLQDALRPLGGLGRGDEGAAVLQHDLEKLPRVVGVLDDQDVNALEITVCHDAQGNYMRRDPLPSARESDHRVIDPPGRPVRKAS